MFFNTKKHQEINDKLDALYVQMEKITEEQKKTVLATSDISSRIDAVIAWSRNTQDIQCEVLEQLRAMVLAQRAANEAFADIISEYTDEGETNANRYDAIGVRLERLFDVAAILQEQTAPSPQSAENQPTEALDADGNKIVFKLDDAMMQDGLASIMGYQPSDRKRGEKL